MTDYFRCLDCGAIVECAYNEWPVCKCRKDYSGDVTKDFDTATEEEYDEWLSEQETE